MDFQKAGILLDKIHALFKNMSADTENISEIEKDLMRAYLRQFYDHFLPQEKEIVESISIELPPVAQPKPARKVEILKPAEEEEEMEEEAPPPPPPKKKEKEPEKIVEPPRPAPDKVQPPRETAPVMSAPESEEDLENLFEHHQARELSEKLSELPIQDLGKAMGLNEKIFTINELFDGDQEAFKQTIGTLNSFPAFEEAKDFLVRDVALRYNWAHPDKKNKAKNFIKLIRRRYPS